MTNPSTPDSPDLDAPARQVLHAMLRKTMTALFVVTSAFAVGLVFVLALTAASGPDDDRCDDNWNPCIEQGGGLFPGGERRPTPATTIPRPTANRSANPVDVEYRATSTDSRIDVRHDGRCEDAASYSVDETDEEIRVTAYTSNETGCERVEWRTVHLRNPVGDRIIVNAEVGLSARPVLR